MNNSLNELRHSEITGTVCLKKKNPSRISGKKPFNFWNNTQEITMAQCHGTGTLQRVRVEEMRSINSAFKPLPPKLTKIGFRLL